MPAPPGQPLPGQPLPGRPLPGRPLPGHPAPADADPGALDEARGLHRRGVAESSALRPARAQPLLRAALATLTASRLANTTAGITLHVQILITAAKAESELRGAQAGMRLLDEAAALLGHGTDPEVVVALHNQRGVVMLRAGRSRDAIEEFNKAEQAFAGATGLEQANVLLNRGTAAMMLGELRAARRDLERCAAVARVAELPLLQCMSLHNLGYLEFLRSDLPRALDLMDQMTEQAAEFGIETNTVALLDRARVLAEAGLTREADRTLAEAAQIQRADRSAQDLAETELERARCALIAGDTAAARRFAARARDRFRRRGADGWRRAAELVLLQGDLAAGRPGARLVRPALRVSSELRAAGQRASSRTAALIAVEAHVLAGQAGPAAQLLASLGPVGALEPMSARLHDRYVRARVAESRARLHEASRQVRSGLEDLAVHQARFGSIDLQSASAVHGRRLAELGIGLALRDGRPAQVFAVAERARAVSTRLPVVRPPADEIAADLLAELRQTVENLRAVGPDRAAAAPLLRRRRSLEDAVAARAWALAGRGAVREVAQLDRISAELADADTAMVMFIAAGDRLHALTLCDGHAVVRDLAATDRVVERARRSRADLDVLAQPRLPAAMAATVRTTLDRSLASLDDALVRPLGLDGRRVVVVSTGVLGQLAWSVMPSLRSNPVVVASSASAWQLAATPAPPSRRRHVMAIAGPDLARAQWEAEAVAGVWAGVAVSGATADRAALTGALADASIAHIATHGMHQTENPLFSSLRLADGPMFAHELDQTARTPEHVVLSACELGLATVRPGDEALGLTSVLLRMGTRSVIAGVARVGDDLAAETMIAYHRRLAGGMDSAAALGEAVAAGGGLAPFVCFGATWSDDGGFGPGRRGRVPLA